MIISLNSCKDSEPGNSNEKINIIQFFKTSKSLSLPLFPNQYRAPVFCQSYLREDSLLVMLHDPTNKQLLEYYTKTNKIIHRIPVDHFRVTNDLVFRYVNKDSIFLCYNASHRFNYFHDSTVKHINYEGELISTPSFTGAPVSLMENKKSLDPNNESYVFNVYWGLIYHNGKLLMNMDAMNFGLGDSLYHSKKFPVGGHLDLKKNNFSSHSVYFPGRNGDYYPTDFSVPHVCVGHNGKLIYGFKNSANLYEYNLKNDELDLHRIKSSMIDTIKPLQLEKVEIFYKRPESDPFQASFYSIIYDEINQQYLHLATLPIDEEDSNSQNQSPIQYAVVTDTNFNRIAEGIVPKEVRISSDMKDKEGYFVWNREKMKEDPSVFIFDHYELQITHGNSSDLKKEIEETRDKTNSKQKGGIKSYVENNYQFAERSLVLFAPLEHSCPSCSNFLIKFFKENQGTLKNTKLYLIIADSDGSMVNHHLSSHQLSRDFQNLYLDEKGLYMEYINHDYGQGRLFIVENGKISSEVIMDPENLDELPLIVEKF